MYDLVDVVTQAAKKPLSTPGSNLIESPHQNTNTSIPYIARPSADRFSNLPVSGSSLVSFQKNRPGRMNETVVDPVEPTKERTTTQLD